MKHDMFHCVSETEKSGWHSRVAKSHFTPEIHGFAFSTFACNADEMKM